MTNEKCLIDANKFFDTVRFADADLCEEDANDNLAFGFTREAIKYMLDEQPTVDAVEVVHGYTIIADNPVKVLLDRKCGICGQLMLATDNYCPMCGARNEGEKIDGLLFADMEEIIDA